MEQAPPPATAHSGPGALAQGLNTPRPEHYVRVSNIMITRSIHEIGIRFDCDVRGS